MSAIKTFQFEPVALRLFGEDDVRHGTYGNHASHTSHASQQSRSFADRPPSTGESHRIPNPVTQFGAAIGAEFADPRVSREDRERATIDLTVSEFYGRFMRSERVSRLKQATIELDDESLAWLVSVGKPPAWPTGPGSPTYAGPPIGCITSKWLASLAAESVAKGLAHNTLGKYLRHLRRILNEAASLGLIAPLKIAIPSEDVLPRPYTTAEVERIYQRLAPDTPMQVAFVLALATGARYSDLFWLGWDEIDLAARQLKFSAEKTDKLHVLPLAEIPLVHLRRLATDRPPFADLVDQRVPPQERGRNQHCRPLNSRWRALTGFASPPRLKRDWQPGAVPHPWHCARATAAVLIEQQVGRMASRLLGHTDKGGERVTQMHYLVPIVPDDLRAAAESVVWPECFRKFNDTDRPRQLSLF